MLQQLFHPDLSLNVLMYTGPLIQSELLSILIRFRQSMHAFTNVEKEDERCQIIKWKRDPSTPLKFYSVNMVTYGIRPALCQATKCLHILRYEFAQKYPFGPKALLKDFFVQDCLSESESRLTAPHTMNVLRSILNSGVLISANDAQTIRNFCSK